MNEQPEFGVKEVFSHIIGDMANAISERPGEGKQEQFARARVAGAMIADLMPRDVAQVMVAGLSVMFHAMMNDSIRETLRGEPDTDRRGTRSNIVAMNKALHMNLDRLDRYQGRAAKRSSDVVEDQPPETESMSEASQSADGSPPIAPSEPEPPSNQAKPAAMPPVATRPAIPEGGQSAAAPPIRHLQPAIEVPHAGSDVLRGVAAPGGTGPASGPASSEEASGGSATQPRAAATASSR